MLSDGLPAAIDYLGFLGYPIRKGRVPGCNVSHVPERLDGIVCSCTFVRATLQVLDNVPRSKVQPPVIDDAEGLNLGCSIVAGQ